MRDASEMQMNPEDLERMHSLELEYHKQQAVLPLASKLLSLLEHQRAILDQMIDICKQGEKL